MPVSYRSTICSGTYRNSWAIKTFVNVYPYTSDVVNIPIIDLYIIFMIILVW